MSTDRESILGFHPDFLTQPDKTKPPEAKCAKCGAVSRLGVGKFDEKKKGHMLDFPHKWDRVMLSGLYFPICAVCAPQIQTMWEQAVTLWLNFPLATADA